MTLKNSGTAIMPIKSLFIVSLFLSFNAFAERLFEEDRADDTWIVHAEKYDDDIQMIALVNGKIIHGDKFRIRILPDRCHVGNTVTSFLTYMDHPEIEQQEGRVISAMFRGIEIKVKILFAIANPGFMGHMVYLDLGWLGLESIKTFFDGYDEMSLELIDDDDFKASDYFDITKNTWSTTRLNEALDLAEMKCKELVNENH